MEKSKLALGSVDIKFFILDILETGHHDVDGSEDIDLSFDKLPPHLARDVPLDNDLPALLMGAHMDIGIPLDDDGAAVHEITGVTPGIALDPDDTSLHPSPVTTVSGSKVISCISFDDELASLHADSGK